MPQALPAQTAPGEAPAATSAPAGELTTLAVVAGARYEKLIGDIGFLGTLVGRPEAAQMAEGGIAFVTQGKGANLLDKSKPWGLIVQTDGLAFYYVGCLPIAKLDDVLEVAKGYGAEITDRGNGTKELVLPNKKSFFVKPQNDVVFISVTEASLSHLPANPQEILARRVADYDLSVEIAVKNVPEGIRQFALQAMQAGMQQGMRKLPDETDEQFAGRQKLAQDQMAQMSRMINEIDTVKIGWAVDAQQQRTYLDFTYQFVAGSKMAQKMAMYTDPRTNFAGFYQPDAAATLTFTTKADPSLIAEDLAQFETMIQNLRQQSDKQIDKKVSDPEAREALKAARNDLLDAVEGTIKEGQIDGAAFLRVSPESLTLIAGMHVKEPAKVESALKNLESTAKKSPDFPGIKWNAANHAGVNFHTLTVPVPETEEAPRRMLGKELNVAVGIGSDTVYIAVGHDNIEAVNKAIDASAAEKGKKVPPFEFALSLGPIMEVAADAAKGPEKQKFQAVADLLKSQAQGRDHIRAVGQIVPNGLRYRIEAEEGVLRAIGAAAAERRQASIRRPGN